MPAAFVDAGGVAELLGLSGRGAFLRKRAELQREHGFPMPMPHSAQPLLWRRSQVLAWIEEHGLRAQDRAQQPTPGADLVLLKEATRA